MPKLFKKQSEVGVFRVKCSDSDMFLKINSKLKMHPPKKYLCEKTKKAINEALSDYVKHDEKESKKLDNLENLEHYIPELT